MMHVSACAFVDHRSRQERALVAATTALSPAAYLRLRREAAGRSVREVAAMIVDTGDDVAMALDLVRVLETPGNTARQHETLDRLQRAFPFDPSVYRQLATDPVDQHPRICRGCGCSRWDACCSAEGACSWSSDTACTRCTGDAAAAGEGAQ